MRKAIGCLLAVYMMLPGVHGAVLPAEAVLREAQNLAQAIQDRSLSKLLEGANRTNPFQDLYQLHAAKESIHKKKSLEAVQKLLQGISQGPTRNRGLQLEITALEQAGENAKASELAARSGLSLSSQVSQEEQDLLKARTLRHAGQHAKADTILLRLADSRLRGTTSRAAVQELYRRYRAGHFAQIPSKPSLLLNFSEILMKHGRNPHAIDLAKRVLAAPRVSTKDEIGRGWLLLGKIYSKKKNRWYAAKCFREAADHLAPKAAEYSESLYQYANTYHLLKQSAKARTGYEEAYRVGGSFAPAALWQLAHLDLEETHRSAGLRKLRQLARTFPRSYFAPKSLWKVALTLLEDEAEPQAIKDAFLEFLNSFPDHRLANAARYRAGLAAWSGHAIRTAHSLWNACIDSPSVPDLYSLFAAQRLAGVKRPSFAARKGPGWERILARFPEEVEPTPIWPGPGPGLAPEVRSRLQALKQVGLLEDLAADLEHWTQQSPGKDFLTRACHAWALHSLGQYRPAVGIFETRKASPLAVPEEERAVFLSGLFPMAYLDQIRPQAKRFGVELPLVLSIAREESHFAPDLQSWANAQGLMQVIPSTAKWIAEKLGRKSPGDLYDPKISSELGSWYLDHLLKSFAKTSEPEVLAIAGYNGGPGNVRRWLRKLPPDQVIAFLDVLDREETFFYVYKVTRSMLAYEAIQERQSQASVSASRPQSGRQG